jgi:hypothetical protein
MLDSFKAQIDAEKARGLLTQDQADQLFKASSAFIDEFVGNQTDPNTIKLTPISIEKG